VARHTFATLGLTYGAELYTVSKLLGHSDIKITQIYADVINEKRRDAVNAIPSITE
ncbi:MAG: tyrosine-type recombinase/integrase, partial [Bacteroides sp.]